MPAILGWIIVYPNKLLNRLAKYMINQLKTEEVPEASKFFANKFRIRDDIADRFGKRAKDSTISLQTSDRLIPFLGILGLVLITVGFIQEIRLN